MSLARRVALVGPGAMGEAMISGIVRNQLVDVGSIICCGPRLERGEQLRTRFGSTLKYSTQNKAANDADVIVLAVKPQTLDKTMKELSPKDDALIVSIIAGATLEKLQAGLRCERIVRAMPNTPAQIGEGVTVWTISKSVTAEHKDVAQKLLGALGDDVFVEEEKYLDMATALSGTGPAYTFMFAEAMIDAGVHMGLPRRIAESLVQKTISGSVHFLKQSAQHPAALRNQVTSPAGTSAEAIYYLEKAGFRTAISRAVYAAFLRAEQLGSGKKKKD